MGVRTPWTLARSGVDPDASPGCLALRGGGVLGFVAVLVGVPFLVCFIGLMVAAACAGDLLSWHFTSGARKEGAAAGGGLQRGRGYLGRPANGYFSRQRQLRAGCTCKTFYIRTWPCLLNLRRAEPPQLLPRFHELHLHQCWLIESNCFTSASRTQCPLTFQLFTPNA